MVTLLITLTSSARLVALGGTILLASLGFATSAFLGREKQWKLGEVPIVFWAQRDQFHSQQNVDDVIAGTTSEVLFVRTLTDSKRTRLGPHASRVLQYARCSTTR